MNTRLENLILNAVRVLALVVCATLATHSPAAKAQGYNQGGQEEWGSDNYLYVWNGANWQAVAWRILDSNNLNAWWQYTIGSDLPPVYLSFDQSGWVWAYISSGDMWVGGPWHNSFSRPLMGNDANSLYMYLGGVWKTWAEWQALFAAGQGSAYIPVGGPPPEDAISRLADALDRLLGNTP
jgi:hypothetical protein